MADQLKQKLRQARDAIMPREDRPTDLGQSRFYAGDNDNGFEHVNYETKETGRGQQLNDSTPEPLDALLLRHRQLAQALLSVEGIEDDDAASVSSGSSNGDVAVLNYAKGAVFVPRTGERSANIEEESLQKMATISPREGDFVDLGHEASSVADLEEYCVEAIQDKASPWHQRLGLIVMAWFVDLIDAFSETNDDVFIRESPKSPLNVKQLRQNIRRCKSQSRPYLETVAGVWDLIAWRSPLFTLLLFWVYMYCVWKGCVISVILFLVLLQLGFNYLSYCRKVKLGLTLLPRKEIKQDMIESPGAQLVLEVARQAQIVLDYVADALEKVKNLLKWKRPRTSAMFALLVLFWFIVSLITTTSVFLTIVGFGIGMKVFVTTYLYHRFPRLRHKLDVFTWFLDRTPADHSFVKEPSIAYSPRSPEDPHPSFTASCGAEPDLGKAKLSRTCALIDKERSFPYSVGSGKLYFTTSHIVFKYSRWSAGERRVVKIPFDDVLAVRKVGNALALEIFASGREKPYLFAGIVRRDDCYASLLALGRTAGVSWAR